MGKLYDLKGNEIFQPDADPAPAPEMDDTAVIRALWLENEKLKQGLEVAHAIIVTLLVTANDSGLIDKELAIPQPVMLEILHSGRTFSLEAKETDGTQFLQLALMEEAPPEQAVTPDVEKNPLQEV